MYHALRDAIIAEVRKHEAEGDCPTARSYGIEMLENVILDLAASPTPAPSGEALRERFLPARFGEDDIEHWVKTPAQVYVQRRNEEIDQLVRETSIAGGEGGTIADWLNLAAGYLRSLGNEAPEQGSLHHSLLIIADQLHAARAALASLDAGGERG